jgi:hypothetical protein
MLNGRSIDGALLDWTRIGNEGDEDPVGRSPLFLLEQEECSDIGLPLSRNSLEICKNTTSAMKNGQKDSKKIQNKWHTEQNDLLKVLSSTFPSFYEPSCGLFEPESFFFKTKVSANGKNRKGCQDESKIRIQSFTPPNLGANTFLDLERTIINANDESSRLLLAIFKGLLEFLRYCPQKGEKAG